MIDEGYTTPEGFFLPRKLLMPDARAFADVLTYLGEYDRDADCTPRQLDGNDLGPYCRLDLKQLGGPQYHGIAVEPTDSAYEAIAQRGLVTDDDRLSFQVIGHGGRNRALITLEHNIILGGAWLAYIDPSTIPASVKA